VLNPNHQVSCEPPKIEEMVQIRSMYPLMHELREMAKTEDCLTSVVCSLAKCERVLNLRGKWHVNNEASASLSEIRYPVAFRSPPSYPPHSCSHNPSPGQP
jgi:hypothetical protein